MPTEEITAIGSRRELLVDEFLIEEMKGGAELRLHHPVPKEVALVMDQPWEGNACGYQTVFKDGDMYRMYYKAWHIAVRENTSDQSQPTVTALAESRDGKHWTRPSLGIFEFQGSHENNIVWTGAGAHNFSPFKDPNPACARDAAYKAMGGLRSNKVSGLLPFRSPDGCHWNRMQNEPVITDGAFDSQNIAFWDPVRGEYRSYYRDFREDEAYGGKVRDIKTSTSSDFLHWSKGEWLTYTGVPTEQLYTNGVMPYPRAPHIFIGLPARYVERRWSPAIEQLPELDQRRLRSSDNERYGTALTDTVLMTSRDGQTFRRWGEAFIRPGLRNRESWVYGDIYTSWQIVETASHMTGAPDELSFYVTEGYFRGTSSSFRRYTLRMDGFVSARATLDGGEVITRPLSFTGDRLTLNMSTSAAGSIRVEIQDAEGRPIDGFAEKDCHEVIGDELERTVCWQGGQDLSRLQERPVRLRFVLTDADLYAFQFV